MTLLQSSLTLPQWLQDNTQTETLPSVPKFRSGNPQPSSQLPQTGGSEAAPASSSLWLAPNQSKRWAELFFLLYTPFWLTLCLGIVVPYKLYESFTELEYLLLALVSAVPSFLIPMLVVGKADKSMPLKDRYWVKASLWIILFSYVGNYFWTHYFFTVLGASYTFPSWKMNNKVQWFTEAAWVLTLAYFIAYLETVAISNFPYYQFVDQESMYKLGSLFYAIYFIVSFPMFLRIDEKPGSPWDLPRVAIDALGAAMLVTIILDLWRIFLGPIIPVPDTKQCFQAGLPCFPGHTNET
ncbi:Cycloeucalenol cycloisomerase [Quillaja saponaria]|uniref:Cycloeucalenol cycloisomerase n=1 Tax=Quillaja saponaria TaxID=32244 RepID=A0AAD7PHQ9_QUISA|nr:Cycloeucalenol cycloisomerase [Quillaja saponaria]